MKEDQDLLGKVRALLKEPPDSDRLGGPNRTDTISRRFSSLAALADWEKPFPRV